jgi:hypothetical protein
MENIKKRERKIATEQSIPALQGRKAAGQF